jgi:hypothetical protein
MKFKSILLIPFIVILSSCSHNTKVSPSVKKVALVQCSVVQPMRILTMMGKVDATPIIQNQLPSLLQDTETLLREYWTIIPAGSFNGLPELQKMSRYPNNGDILSPVINGIQMPAFSDWKVGSISRDDAKKLCNITGADAVILTVSSWEVQGQGTFVVAQYPLSYISLAMYDKNGNLLFHNTASETYNDLYGYYSMTIDEKSIGIWKKMSVKLTKDILIKYAR